MSRIKDRDYDSEAENFFEAKQIIKREAYKKHFLSLYDYFIDKQNTFITNSIFQQISKILYRPRAHDVLMAFSILNMLRRNKKQNRREIYYLVVNEDWWRDIKEEITTDGDSEEDQ